MRTFLLSAVPGMKEADLETLESRQAGLGIWLFYMFARIEGANDATARKWAETRFKRSTGL